MKEQSQNDENPKIRVDVHISFEIDADADPTKLGEAGERVLRTLGQLSVASESLHQIGEVRAAANEQIISLDKFKSFGGANCWNMLIRLIEEGHDIPLRIDFIETGRIPVLVGDIEQTIAWLVRHGYGKRITTLRLQEIYDATKLPLLPEKTQ